MRYFKEVILKLYGYLLIDLKLIIFEYLCLCIDVLDFIKFGFEENNIYFLENLLSD